MRQLSVFAILVLLAGACSSGCNTGTENENPVVVSGEGDSGEVATSGVATLEIEFGTSRENLVLSVPCDAQSTVFTLLKHTQAEGELTFESSGAGETVFVKSIAGVKNQAARGDNWVYRVNGSLGDRSCGLFSVKPGDHVLWVFGSYP